MANLEIKLTSSFISRKPKQVATAKALGLNKINQVVVKPNNDTIRGMVKAISHMVEVKEID